MELPACWTSLQNNERGIGYEITLLYHFFKELLAIENQTYSTKVKMSKNKQNSLYLHGVQGAVSCVKLLRIHFILFSQVCLPVTPKGQAPWLCGKHFLLTVLWKGTCFEHAKYFFGNSRENKTFLCLRREVIKRLYSAQAE